MLTCYVRQYLWNYCCLFYTISHFNQGLYWVLCLHCSCFHLLWNFLFLAGSGLKYGVNVYHILKFCQPRTIRNEMVWGLQCEEYSFLTPLKNTKITHFTQHWTTVYTRNVPHIMVLLHIMKSGIHEDVSSFCFSNDIIIILHLQWEWH